MKQMKVDSPENAGGKNANKCSWWRLHNFLLFHVHSWFIHYPNCTGASYFIKKLVQTFLYKPLNI